MAQLHEGTSAGTLYFSTTPQRYAEAVRRLSAHLGDVAMLGRVVLRDEDRHLSDTPAGRFHLETFLSECRSTAGLIFGIGTFDPDLAGRAGALFVPIQRIAEVERGELRSETFDAIAFCDPE